MEKIISFQIPKSQREFVRYQEDRGPYFYDKLHQHPQCQLTVILEGSGQFLSGDYVGRFQGGDVFFLGENGILRGPVNKDVIINTYLNPRIVLR